MLGVYIMQGKVKLLGRLGYVALSYDEQIALNKGYSAIAAYNIARWQAGETSVYV